MGARERCIPTSNLWLKAFPHLLGKGTRPLLIINDHQSLRHITVVSCECFYKIWIQTYTVDIITTTDKNKVTPYITS